MTRDTTQTNFIRTMIAAGPLDEDRMTERLAALGDRATDELLACLQDDDVGIRAIALILLARTHDPRALEPIIRFVHDDSRYRRAPETDLSLRQRLFRRYSRWWRETLAYIEETEPAIDLSRAARALGEIGGPEAVATLRHLSSHPHELVRSQAREALTALGAA